MRLYHVADRDKREIRSVGLARARIVAARTSAAIAGADDVGADDKVAIRIEQTTGTKNSAPPVRHIRIGCKSMAHPNHIVAFGIEGAVSMICNGQLRQNSSCFQRERLVVLKKPQRRNLYRYRVSGRMH